MYCKAYNERSEEPSQEEVEELLEEEEEVEQDPPSGRAPAPPANAPQQPAQPPQDVKMMGALPTIFAGNRKQADDFIEQLKGYIRLNRLVPGMNSYIQ